MDQANYHRTDDVKAKMVELNIKSVFNVGYKF